MAFTFLHAADLHLDSPLVNLARYEGAPVDDIRAASRKAFTGLVDLALERGVDFVLLAGDLFDGDWPDFNTGLFFRNQMRRLLEASIPALLITGNHDAKSKVGKSLPLALPDNVVLFPADEPGSHVLEDLGVAVHGQSFATAKETRNLAREYPEPEPGCFNIGLLHTALTGREGHETYAPCTLEDLRAKGYGYWALGHVHQFETVSQEPWIVFPGVIQGRHVRESGPKGCVLVHVDGAGRANPEFIALDVLRWALLQVDATGAAHGQDLLERVQHALEQALEQAEERPLAARLILDGPCQAHAEIAADPELWTNEIRAKAQDLGGDHVWIEKVRVATSLPEETARSGLDLDHGPWAELESIAAQAMEGGRAARDMGQCLETLFRTLPPEFRRSRPDLSLDNPDWLRDMVAQARALLKDRLFSQDKDRSLEETP